MMPAYEYFETAAGIGVIGRGATAAEAFVQTALAVFALIVEPGGIGRSESAREVRAHGDTLEALLVAWINECLYVHDVEGFVARRVEIEVFDGTAQAGGERLRLHSFLHGEEVDPARHRLGTVVKAATMRQVAAPRTDKRIRGPARAGRVVSKKRRIGQCKRVSPYHRESRSRHPVNSNILLYINYLYSIISSGTPLALYPHSHGSADGRFGSR
jgi:SHS2 domain-containing protein